MANNALIRLLAAARPGSFAQSMNCILVLVLVIPLACSGRIESGNQAIQKSKLDALPYSDGLPAEWFKDGLPILY